MYSGKVVLVLPRLVRGDPEGGAGHHARCTSGQRMNGQYPPS
jgi:hypothetical protein